MPIGLGLSRAALLMRRPPVREPGPGGSLADSVTDNGVTFTFFEPRPVGQYANGDWWVVGPVEITSISPDSETVDGTFADGSTYSGRVVHGAMLNPGNRSHVGGSTAANAVGSDQGLDSMDTALGASGSTLQDYDAQFNVDPGNTGEPLVVTEGTVIKAISNLTPPKVGRPSIHVQVPLTVVTSAPAVGSFRPAIAVASKASIATEEDLDTSFLPSLAVPDGAVAPDLAALTAMWKGPWWLGHTQNTQSRNMTGHNNRGQPEYGREIGRAVADGLLSLCLDYTNEQKHPLLVNMVQLGIDVQGRIDEGGVFPGNGGGEPWRKMAVSLAAKALPEVAALTAAASDTTRFQEDQCYFFVSQEDVERERYTADGRPRAPYGKAMIGSPEWGEQHTIAPQRDGSNWNAFYRANNYCHMNQQVLGAQLLGLPHISSALMKYQDRVWNRVRSDARGGSEQLSDFAWRMWDAYRGDTSAAVPTAQTAQAENDRLWLIFDHLMDEMTTPAPSDFTVLVNGSGRTVSAVKTWGYGAELTLASPVAAGDDVSVAYISGDVPLRNIRDINTGNISATEVENLHGDGEPGGGEAYSTDFTAPNGTELSEFDDSWSRASGDLHFEIQSNQLWKPAANSNPCVYLRPAGRRNPKADLLFGSTQLYLLARASVNENDLTGYGLRRQDATNFRVFRIVDGSLAGITIPTTGSTVVTNFNELEVGVETVDSSTVRVTVYQAGEEIARYNDTHANRITADGTTGLHFAGGFASAAALLDNYSDQPV